MALIDNPCPRHDVGRSKYLCLLERDVKCSHVYGGEDNLGIKPRSGVLGSSTTGAEGATIYAE